MLFISLRFLQSLLKKKTYNDGWKSKKVIQGKMDDDGLIWGEVIRAKIDDKTRNNRLSEMFRFFYLWLRQNQKIVELQTKPIDAPTEKIPNPEIAREEQIKHSSTYLKGLWESFSRKWESMQQERFDYVPQFSVTKKFNVIFNEETKVSKIIFDRYFKILVDFFTKYWSQKLKNPKQTKKMEIELLPEIETWESATPPRWIDNDIETIKTFNALPDAQNQIGLINTLI